MRAVVLAGGAGSRLKPFTIVVPKPLVPIGEQPILEILVRQLRAQGFERITLAVGYHAALIEAYCGNGERWGIPIDYVREGEPLGTAGFLSLVEDLKEDRVLVVNGDILTDLDMGAVARDHDVADGATICVNRRSIEIEFGVVEADGDGALSSYTEKPVLSYDVSMGINILSSWAIERFASERRHLDMPDLIRAIAAAGGVVRVRLSDATWLDMGSMDDLDRAVEAFAANPGRFLP
jgi:NDP-sugar pyrophosphorylase family protein